MFIFKIDGKEYPLADLAHFTGRELHLIKRLSGCRSAEIVEGIRAGDTDVYIALLMIAMKRNGVEPNEDAILDRDFSDIDLSALQEKTDGPLEDPVAAE